MWLDSWAVDEDVQRGDVDENGDFHYQEEAENVLLSIRDLFLED
jgi:hypothetical protein